MGSTEGVVGWLMIRQRLYCKLTQRRKLGVKKYGPGGNTSHTNMAGRDTKWKTYLVLANGILDLGQPPTSDYTLRAETVEGCENAQNRHEGNMGRLEPCCSVKPSGMRIQRVCRT